MKAIDRTRPYRRPGQPIFLFLLALLGWTAKAQADLAEGARRMCKKMQQNIVALNPGETGGFGFIVGESGDTLLIGTAYHVVQELPAKEIPMAFHGMVPGIAVLDSVILSDRYDFALLRTRKPDGFAWIRRSLDRQEQGLDGEEAVLMARNGNWSCLDDFVIESPKPNDGEVTVKRDLPAGTSGVPIVTAQGIIGISLRDDNGDQRGTMLHISKILELLRQAGSGPQWAIPSVESLEERRNAGEVALYFHGSAFSKAPTKWGYLASETNGHLEYGTEYVALNALNVYTGVLGERLRNCLNEKDTSERSECMFRESGFLPGAEFLITIRCEEVGANSRIYPELWDFRHDHHAVLSPLVVDPRYSPDAVRLANLLKENLELSRIGKLNLAFDPPRLKDLATLKIDGEIIALSEIYAPRGVQLPLVLGKHTLLAEAENRKTFQRDVVLQRGKSEKIEIKMDYTDNYFRESRMRSFGGGAWLLTSAAALAYFTYRADQSREDVRQAEKAYLQANGESAHDRLYARYQRRLSDENLNSAMRNAALYSTIGSGAIIGTLSLLPLRF